MAVSRTHMRSTLEDTLSRLDPLPSGWTVHAEYDINTMTWTPRKIERAGGKPTMKTFLIEDAIDEMDAYRKFLERVK